MLASHMINCMCKIVSSVVFDKKIHKLCRDIQFEHLAIHLLGASWFIRRNPFEHMDPKYTSEILEYFSFVLISIIIIIIIITISSISVNI